MKISEDTLSILNNFCVNSGIYCNVDPGFGYFYNLCWQKHSG